ASSPGPPVSKWLRPPPHKSRSRNPLARRQEISYCILKSTPWHPTMATGTTNSIENTHRLLEKCTLFRGLPTEDRDRLIARARIRHFAAGQTIFTMGAPGDSMLAVLNGEVRISVPSYRDRELQLAILQPGEVFGEIAVLDGKERTADAQAITDCDLAV